MNAWISSILELASNAVWIIGIFIFFTILLHLIFVVWFPISLRTWKIADYLWLCLVFLSLLGLVGEAKQYRAETSYNEKEWNAQQSLSDVRSWFSNYQIYICEEAKILKEKNLNGTDYHHLCDWLEKRINDLNLMQKGTDHHPEISLKIIEGLHDYTTIIPRLEQKILARRIERYNEKRAQNIENLKALQRTSLQQIMLILAPVMFALALAIRITKVTAEFRLLNPKNHTQ